MALFAVSYGSLGIRARTATVLLASLFVPIACWLSARQLEESQARRFWRTIAFAFSLWWLLLVTHIWMALAGIGPAPELLLGLAFGSLYLLLVAAVAGHAHEPLAGHRRGLDLLAQWPAAAILVTSLVGYFVMLPAMIGTEAPLQLPLLGLLVALDAYLAIQLAVLASAAGPVRWRAVTTLLTVMTVAWLISDLDDLFRTLRGAGPSSNVWLRAIWISAAVLAARTGAARANPRWDEARHHEVLDPRTPAQTIGAAVALPLIHIVAWKLRLFPDALRARQEILLLAAVASLGILAWLQHRMLSQVTSARLRERAEREEAVQRRRVGLRLQRERERADAAVQAVEDRFATVFRACPSAMVITRLEDGVVVDLNESFESITRFSRHACFGKTTIELGLWPESEDRERFAARLAAGKEVRNAELILGDSPEDRRAFWVDATRVELEDGPGVLALARPKAAVDDDLEGPLPLEERSVRLAGVDREGRICAWTGGIEALTGIDRDQAMTREVREVFDLPPGAIEGDGTTTFQLTVARQAGHRERLSARWFPVGAAAPAAGVIVLDDTRSYESEAHD